jgi:hypothetical protein
MRVFSYLKFRNISIAVRSGALGGGLLTANNVDWFVEMLTWVNAVEVVRVGLLDCNSSFADVESVGFVDEFGALACCCDDRVSVVEGICNEELHPAWYTNGCG